MHQRRNPPVRPHAERPGVKASRLRDEQVLDGLDGADSIEWRARLHAEEMVAAEIEAWERPKTIHCVTCREDIGKSVRLGPVDWDDELNVEAEPHGSGWRCSDCARADRERMLAEQARILQAAQQRG